MKKRVLVSLMVVVMVFSNVVAFAGSYEDGIHEYRVYDTEKQVEALVNMGLIQGNDEGDLLLEDDLVRVEGAIVYTRLFGLVDDVYYYEGTSNKFKDLPDWGMNHVNLLSDKGVVQGLSENMFGSLEVMTAEQFTTMVLRGMGFDDKAGDFVWSESLDKALEIGMLTEEVKSTIEQEDRFTREEMMIISYNALFTPTKGGKLLMQTRQRPYDTSMLGVITLELTEQEIDQIYKLELGSSKKPFSNDSQAQEELFKKIQEYIQKAYDLSTVTINGEVLELEASGVTNITQAHDRGIAVELESGGDMNLDNNGTTVFMGKDASYLSHLTLLASQNIVNYNYEGISGITHNLFGMSDDTYRELKATKGDKTIFEAIVNIDLNNLSIDVEIK